MCVSARLNALIYGMPKCREEGRMKFVNTNSFLKLFVNSSGRNDIYFNCTFL